MNPLLIVILNVEKFKGFGVQFFFPAGFKDVGQVIALGLIVKCSKRRLQP